MSRKIGTGMTVAAWIAVIGVLTLLSQKYLDRLNNPNESYQTVATAEMRELVLERNRYGHYIATGSINGRRAVFLLDTGATDIAVPEQLAERLGLKRGPQTTVVTANGIIDVDTARLDEVALGPIVLRNLRATINPHMRDDEVLLGMAFLRDIEFTQRGEYLTLRQRPQPPQ